MLDARPSLRKEERSEPVAVSEESGPAIVTVYTAIEDSAAVEMTDVTVNAHTVRLPDGR